MAYRTVHTATAGLQGKKEVFFLRVFKFKYAADYLAVP